MKKTDLLLIAAALLAAGALYLFLRPGSSGAWAVVTVDGEEWGRFPLSEERTVTIGGADYNILEISGGEAAVTAANCGDLTCVRTGRVSREGERIVCLPHRVMVRIEGGGAALYDALAG